MLDQAIVKFREIDEVQEHVKEVVKKTNEIQKILDIMIKRTGDDYFRMELFEIYADYGSLVDKLVKAFRKSFQEVKQ